ncbi:hypothetical protein K402DRAFT_317912, partial [Aulographum hederae CBS 113979]
DPHHHFCLLVGATPSHLPPGAPAPQPAHSSLYKRAIRQKRSQNCTYLFTAALSNTLLLTQVMLGAALTALGASESSHILITVFGALNTVIAGLVAYLKSRGQPMRSRMYRDDLERVVDEIENSEIMWLGISRNVHGYDEVDPEQVTVRSEVARLTRLYDRAVRNNTMNNPDMYMAGGGFEGVQTGLRARPTPGATVVAPTPVPAPVPAPGAGVGGPPQPPAPLVTTLDPDESPATATKTKAPPLPEGKEGEGESES